MRYRHLHFWELVSTNSPFGIKPAWTVCPGSQTRVLQQMEQELKRGPCSALEDGQTLMWILQSCSPVLSLEGKGI